MSTLVVPQVASGLSNEQLADIVAKLSKEVDWFSRNIDSKNVRNIAGYNVSEFEIKHMSGIVGMSGYDYTNPNAVRFWSGSANKEEAPFRVTQDGTMYATNGNFTGNITGSIITGGEIYGAYIATADGTYPRTEMSVTENLFAIYYSATQYIKMLADASGQPTISFHNGSVDGSLGAFVIGSMLALNTTVGQGNIQISSGQSLTLHAQGLIQIDSWSKMRNQNTLRTLQQDLDALDARISDLENPPPA